MKLIVLMIALSGCEFKGAATSIVDAASDAPSVDAKPSGPWGRFRHLAELEVIGPGNYDDPMMADDREIFFAGPGAGGQDFYSAVRRPNSEIYDTPQLLRELSTDESDSTLWISPEALTILVGISSPASSLDIYISTRGTRDQPFSAPLPIGELTPGIINSQMTDGLGCLGNGGRELYFASNRENRRFDIYVARRPEPTGPFESVRKLALNAPMRAEASPKLSRDELTLYFSAGQPQDLHPFQATRTALGDVFGNVERMTDVDSAGTRNTDFVSDQDDVEAVFASDRHQPGGNEGIFSARRAP